MKNKVLTKLAQTRLAVNYILRNRIIKQADVSRTQEKKDPYLYPEIEPKTNYRWVYPSKANVIPAVENYDTNPLDNGDEFSITTPADGKVYFRTEQDMNNHILNPEEYPLFTHTDYPYPFKMPASEQMVYPGDVDYDPYKGVIKTHEYRFVPYNRNKKEPAIPQLKNIYTLKPNTVATKQNTYVYPKPPMYKYRQQYNSENTLHTKLFGVPAYRTNYNIDITNIDEMVDRDEMNNDIGTAYWKETVAQPYLDTENALLFMNQQTRDGRRARNFLKSTGFELSDEAINDLQQRILELNKEYSDRRDIDFARFNREEHYNKYKKYKPGTATWLAKRDRLMHDYIDRTPIGLAHNSGVVPKMLTSIPYYGYHMLPYTQFAASDWRDLYKNKEGLRANIALTRKENPWLDNGLKTVGNLFKQINTNKNKNSQQTGVGSGVGGVAGLSTK